MKKKYIIFDFDGTLVDSTSKEFFEGTVQMIKNLSKNYKLFISSQTDDEILKDYLKKADIYQYFEVIFGGSVREKGQKHIEVFDMVLEDQSFANRTVYIGDSELDREIAKEAGISFVKIGKEGKDYYEIDNISEFEDYIEKVK